MCSTARFYMTVSYLIECSKNSFEQGQICGLLLGDNGYACRLYLLTPVIYPTNTTRKNYNRAHKAYRNLIERVNGFGTGVFLAAYTEPNDKLDTIVAVIYGTAVLHNIISAEW
ncbi:hypothetical protein NQ314_019835 [Rhamnusium bicolor]|uniref:DDE Tnp4 domain-containing protein n=1 Tax=Rhamnusium bicolor TaxID=1586634 RepID=A0AAV8WMU6_9CUCU|nr:hypothetical protein NQ314_019835 [Rhamnusium bicolor]